MLLFFFFVIFAFILSATIDGRVDDDTESTNTSFEGQINHLYGDFNKCEIKLDGEFVPAKARVQPRFQMPTCLKTFYEKAFLSGCGMPLYDKFAYCAKALFFKNQDYNKFDAKEEWKKRREILVLIDGCLACPKYPERASNVEIKLFATNKAKKPLAITVSDRFADFKIGAIIKVKGTLRQIQPQLEIVHYCNQFHVRQKKILTLPTLHPFMMEYNIFESVSTSIWLPQQSMIKQIVPL